MKNWSDEDLIIVCEIFYQSNLTLKEQKAIGMQLTGRSEGSIGMRLSNYKYLNDPTHSSGLNNPGENCIRIWGMFQKEPEAMHRKAEELMEKRGWLS